MGPFAQYRHGWTPAVPFLMQSRTKDNRTMQQSEPSEPKFLDLTTGRRLKAEDPKRGVWYATNPHLCGYWTDDWSKLSRFGVGTVVTVGIPCCPFCGCPGMQITFEEWMGGAREHERKEDKPRYADFVTWHKEKCAKRNGTKWGDRYALFAAGRESELTMAKTFDEALREDLRKGLEKARREGGHNPDLLDKLGAKLEELGTDEKSIEQELREVRDAAAEDLDEIERKGDRHLDDDDDFNRPR